MESDLRITTLHNLLDHLLGKFTAGEILLKKDLPEWIRKTQSLLLKQVLEKYLQMVEEHVQKMQDFVATETLTSLSLSNRVMEALVEETNEDLNKCTDAEVIDACILASIQNFNHYKISSYGTAAAFAAELELEQFSAVFYELEINEKNMDDRLSQLAKFEVNKKARAPIRLTE